MVLAALIACLAHAAHRRTEAHELRAPVAGFVVVTVGSVVGGASTSAC